MKLGRGQRVSFQVHLQYVPKVLSSQSKSLWCCLFAMLHNFYQRLPNLCLNLYCFFLSIRSFVTKKRYRPKCLTENTEVYSELLLQNAPYQMFVRVLTTKLQLLFSNFKNISSQCALTFFFQKDRAQVISENDEEFSIYNRYQYNVR